jgi:AraC-like DNA-binding protein
MQCGATVRATPLVAVMVTVTNGVLAKVADVTGSTAALYPAPRLTIQGGAGGVYPILAVRIRKPRERAGTAGETPARVVIGKQVWWGSTRPKGRDGMHDRAALLQPHLVFASKNLEETRAFMHGKEFFLDVHPRDAGLLDFVAHAAYLPGSYIGCIHYGPAVSVRLPPDRRRDDFWIHFPLRGNFEVINKAGRIVSSPTRSAVSSPDGHVMRSEAGSARVTLSVSKATAMAQLAALLGDVPDRPLEFLPEFDLAGTWGRRLSRHMYLAMCELDAAWAEPPSVVMLNMYEQLIVTSLLLGQPSNYTAALNRLEDQAASGDVKRAIDFIDAHLHLPITLADIAQAAGVPGRTLLEHFKHHRGVSPVRYLRNARFARVREALLGAESKQTVTQIAMKWGFYHMGRFAAEYCQRFGEIPSQTYRRGRGARR